MNRNEHEARTVPKIQLLILDVDGVLTSGALTYDGDGQRQATFHVHDGGAVRLWQKAGGHVAIISGRRTPAVDRRAVELGIDHVVQGVADKLPAYLEACQAHGVDDSAVSYIGDDLPDLAPMGRCAYPVAVAGAVPVVKRAARYVTRLPGGAGAVGETIARLMRFNGTWSGAIGTRTAREPSVGDARV